jgi:hypothetical protein
MTVRAHLGSGGGWRTVTVEWREGDVVYFENADYGESNDLGDGMLVRDGLGLLVWLIGDRFCSSGSDEEPLFRYLAAHGIPVEPAPGILPNMSSYSGLVRLDLVDRDLVVTAGPAAGPPSAYVVGDRGRFLCQLVADRCQGSGAWTRITDLLVASGAEVEHGWFSSDAPTDDEVADVADQLKGMGLDVIEEEAAVDGIAVAAAARARRGQHLWEKLPTQLTKALAREKGLRVSKAPEDLLAAAGDPPSPEFVVEVWPVLVDKWLARRPGPRERLVGQLKAAGAGSSRRDVSDRAGQLKFLSACSLDTTTAQLVLDELTDFANAHFELRYPEGWDPDNPKASSVGVLRANGSVLMRSHRRDDLTSYLDAKRGRDGTLVLSGHDMGEYVESYFGRDEYEYTKTYSADAVPLVLEALGEDPAADVMEVIVARWCGDDRSFEFERLLGAADIPHDRLAH